MKLEAIDISFKYGKGSRQILDHVNLSVEPGEKVGIMAPSGYGKTTLCKMPGMRDRIRGKSWSMECRS